MVGVDELEYKVFDNTRTIKVSLQAATDYENHCGGLDTHRIEYLLASSGMSPEDSEEHMNAGIEHAIYNEIAAYKMIPSAMEEIEGMYERGEIKDVS